MKISDLVKELDGLRRDYKRGCDDLPKNYVRGSEAMLKVIMARMNNTIKEIISKKAEEKIKEELTQRVAEPIKVKKIQEGKMICAGKYQIASNFNGRAREHVIRVLRTKKMSELMLIN